MVALAQNSRPALPMLSNTCAGIKEPGTFAHVARIRVAITWDGPDDHLELVFEQDTVRKKAPIIRSLCQVKLSRSHLVACLDHGAVKVGEVYGGL